MRGDPANWLPAMRIIAERHGLDSTALYAERTGTNVVFRAGDEAWIKLIAPLWPEDYDREQCGLSAMNDLDDIPAPRLLADGELEGWPYLVLGTVEGASVVTVWAGLGRKDQIDLATQIGELMARMHAVPTTGMAALEHDWDAFMARQRTQCGARHVRRGVDAHWQVEVDRYLEAAPMLDAPDSEPVFLHADITDEHVLVKEQGGRWTVTGIIDFADAMIGQPLYEFAAPAVFLTQRQPWAQRALLRGYGFAEAELTETLAQRLTAYVLLHRYGNLVNTLRFCPRPMPATAAELQTALFDFH